MSAHHDADARAEGGHQVRADPVNVRHVNLGREGDHDRLGLSRRQMGLLGHRRLTSGPGTAAPGRRRADTSQPGTAAGSTTAQR
jgi:hypothetical protein